MRDPDCRKVNEDVIVIDPMIFDQLQRYPTVKKRASKRLKTVLSPKGSDPTAA